MAEQKSREEHVASWWARWRAEDYSWDGLQWMPWVGWAVAPDGAISESLGAPEGARDATLQDYWRDEEPYLIEGEGSRWTRVHCPLAWADGTPTPKANWREEQADGFQAILSAKLGAAAENTFGGQWDERQIVGADRRAQFQGAVLFGAPALQDKENPFSVTFESAAFLVDASFHNATFAGDAVFSRTAFLGEADFERAGFHEHAEFDEVVFSKDAAFRNASFGGEASFAGCTFFGGGEFDNTAFVKSADFSGAHFQEHGAFLGAAFGGHANFARVVFVGDARFYNAAFSSDASFASAVLVRDARFNSATFSGNANFIRTAFSGLATFEQVSFSDALFRNAIFRKNAHFNTVFCSGDVNFNYANFAENVYFNKATFGGEARFDEGEFRGAYFTEARAEKAFSARARSFVDFSYFDDMIFEGDMDFSNAVFEKAVSFERILWPTSACDWHCAFDQALFRSTAEFTGAGFKALAAFDGAVLERGIKIDDLRESRAKNVFTQERIHAINSAKFDAEKLIENEQRRQTKPPELDWLVENAKRFEVAGPVKARTIRQKRAEAREARLKELERGCRVLKQSMEYSSNKTREQLFYRFELLARRAQKDTPDWEKTFSDLYGMVSDYGASMARPLVALIMLIMFFANLFYGLAALRGLTTAALAQDIWQAADFSLANVFKPLSAISNEAVQKDTIMEKLLVHAGYGWTTFVRALSIVQSLLAIVLAFLFALAVRRRFQIT